MGKLTNRNMNKKGYGGVPPMITEQSSKLELIQYFNWINFMVEKKDLQDLFKSKHPNVDMSYVDSSTLAVCYGYDVGMSFPQHITDKFNQTLKHKIQKQPQQIEAKVPPKNDTPLSEFIADIEEMIDNQEEVDFYQLFTERNVDKRWISRLIEVLTPIIEELNLAKQKQIEGYTHLKRNHITKMIDQYQTVIDQCESYINNKKRVVKKRKPRKRSTSVMLKHITPLNEFPELRIISINPEKILGAKALWFYDVKQKKLTMLVAKDDKGLGVNRTSITNFDEKQSLSKRMGRQAQQILEMIVKTTPARRMKVIHNDVNTTRLEPSNRINNNVVLLYAKR